MHSRYNRVPLYRQLFGNGKEGKPIMKVKMRRSHKKIDTLKDN
jgi:hypothetical protein